MDFVYLKTNHNQRNRGGETTSVSNTFWKDRKESNFVRF